MNDYRSNAGSSTSKSRTAAIKSPSSHENVDAKIYRKKYQKRLEQLMLEKERTQELERMIEEMTLKLEKQAKELQKKQQIEDVLLMQISQMKLEVESSSRSSKTLSKQNSIEQNRLKTKRSQQNSKNSEFDYQNSESQSINGYNFTLSELPYNAKNSFSSYQSDLGQNSYQKSQPSNHQSNNSSGQEFSGSFKSNDSVGGYMKKVFNL